MGGSLSTVRVQVEKGIARGAGASNHTERCGGIIFDDATKKKKKNKKPRFFLLSILIKKKQCAMNLFFLIPLPELHHTH